MLSGMFQAQSVGKVSYTIQGGNHAVDEKLEYIMFTLGIITVVTLFD